MSGFTRETLMTTYDGYPEMLAPGLVAVVSVNLLEGHLSVRVIDTRTQTETAPILEIETLMSYFNDNYFRPFFYEAEGGLVLQYPSSVTQGAQAAFIGVEDGIPFARSTPSTPFMTEGIVPAYDDTLSGAVDMAMSSLPVYLGLTGDGIDQLDVFDAVAMDDGDTVLAIRYPVWTGGFPGSPMREAVVKIDPEGKPVDQVIPVGEPIDTFVAAFEGDGSSAMLWVDEYVAAGGRGNYQYVNTYIETLDFAPRAANLPSGFSISASGDGAMLSVDLTGAVLPDASSVSWYQDGRVLRETGETFDVTEALADTKIWYEVSYGPSDPGQRIVYSEVLAFGSLLAGGSDDADTLWGGPAARFVIAAGGSDAVYLGPEGDQGFGGAGDDSLYGREGDDLLFGGDGDDSLTGGAGEDTISGGLDNDLIEGSVGDDRLSGGDGADSLFGGAGDDTVAGGAGDDAVGGGIGNDRLEGGAGNDALWGSAGDDSAEGGLGNDTLAGSRGNDTLSGGAGDDALWGSLGDDSLLGGDGADLIGGSVGDDTVVAGDGDDKVWGAQGDDSLSGGAGNDEIGASLGNDFADGGTGDDLVFGGLGADTVLGGDGSDTLYGAAGDDVMAGGAGDDLLFVGPGADIVRFGVGDDADEIRYFSLTDDRLELDSALWSGTLSTEQVVAEFGDNVGDDYVFVFDGGEILTLTGRGVAPEIEGIIDIV